MQELGSIAYGMDIDIKSGETAFNTVNNQAKKTEAQLKKFDTQVTKTAQSVKRGLTPNLGQAGIQVQQFVGQLQGGQSAMVALAQQSADLGIVLGAPLVGVIVSLGAVLLGTLLPSLMSNKTSADALEKSIEKVKAVMTLGADGVVEYADQMKELNKVSEQLAKIKLAETIINQNEVIKNSSKAIIESAESTSKFYKSTFEELRGLTESVAKDIGGDMNDVAEAIKSGQNIGTAGSYLNRDLDRISKMFKITRSEALELGLAMSDVAKKGDAVSIKSLQNVTEDLAETYGYSNEKITKLASGMVKYFIDTKQATDGVNELRMALFGKGQEIDEDIDKVRNAEKAYESLTNQLEIERIALEVGARAAFEKSLQNQNLDETQRKALLSLYDYNEGLKEQSDSLKQTTSDLEWYEQQLQKIKDKEKRDKATLTTQVQSIGLTPEEEIKARYDKELELLRQAEEQKIEIEGTYSERRTQIEKERQEAIRNMQGETNELMENAFGNLDTQIAGTMAQVVTGAKDGKEAMSALASTILTQVIGAVVQWGIAEVTKMMTVETAEKGMQAANAAATTASVSAQVAMNTALAAQNAFMATAAIPVVGPLLAPAAAAAAGAVSASLGASAIGLAPVAGAREYGGPVTNGKSYLVGERGPEIFTPHVAGGITSNKDMSSGGGGMTVNVSNNTPYEVYVTQDQAANIANVQIGKEAKKASQGRGNIFKGLSSSTNVRNKANRG